MHDKNGRENPGHFQSQYLMSCASGLACDGALPSAACAAASRAIGTRKGEQDT